MRDYKELVKRVQAHLQQLAPHARKRQSAKLLEECADAIAFLINTVEATDAVVAKINTNFS